jgi:hypothetical protein
MRKEKWSNNDLYNNKIHDNYLELLKKYCWSENDTSSNNDVQLQYNDSEIPFQLHCHSSMQCVRGNVLKFDIVSLLKRENGLEEIIICKVIDESHMRNLELTCLGTCGNDPVLYIVCTNDT